MSSKTTARSGAAKSRAEKGTRGIVTRSVSIDGITDVMFDRYPGDNQTVLEAWQKLYFDPANDRHLVLPSQNLMSFLSAQNTDSAPKRLLDARTYKKTALACLSFVTIGPAYIPFLRDGKPVAFGRFEGDRDPESGVYIHRSVARLEKGIPNPKVRPVLPLPWSLAFTITIYPNPHLQEQQLINIFEGGGIALGIGTFRGQFGKFRVASWE
jgi:hypothetical protein